MIGYMMNDLIINGIDHSVFDLEWAKRGGVVYHYCDFCRYICDGFNYNEIRVGQDGEFLIGEEKTVGLVSILTTKKVENSPYYLRMATPYECDDAGVYYIEPPSRWLPIESAPKDGTFFDVWNQRFKVRECNVRYVAGGFYVGEMRISSGATHWMSQPQPPKDELL
jgi:hypothetical protein